MAITYVGAWRAGMDGHFLWQNADWRSFTAKWNELSGDGLRLARITTFLGRGQRRWTGVWREGSRGHYLSAGADWNDFTDKWEQSSAERLRLVDIKPYVDNGQVKWAGVWREGTDAHYLWNADRTIPIPVCMCFLSGATRPTAIGISSIRTAFIPTRPRTIRPVSPMPQREPVYAIRLAWKEGRPQYP